MKTVYEAARDTLIVIESIASGSTTANSLPNLARIARDGLMAIDNSRKLKLDADGILSLWRDCGHACNDGNALKFARAIEAEVASRCRAQGGMTPNKAGELSDTAQVAATSKEEGDNA